MGNRVEPLRPGRYYHVYSHAVEEENLFRNEDNYRYFLDRYVVYIPPIAATFAYCLMPNHFHLLIRVRATDALLRFFREKKGAAVEKPDGFVKPVGSARQVQHRCVRHPSPLSW